MTQAQEGDVTMTVKELIDVLNTMNQDAVVYLRAWS